MFTAPPSTKEETNDQYIIKTLLGMADSSLNPLFSLENYNQNWNKESLIEAIQEILANNSSTTTSLSRQEYSKPTNAAPDSSSQLYEFPFYPNNKYYQNKITIIDSDNSANTFLNEGMDLEGQDGSISMKLNNGNILQGSDINFVYNIPKDIIKNSDGSYITLNSENPKCDL
jgi:hypothetical protein